MPKRRTPLPDWILTRRQTLGHRIAAFRTASGQSQEQLAGAIGMDRRSIQRYEAGTRDPRYADLLLIADAIGVPLSDLVRE